MGLAKRLLLESGRAAFRTQVLEHRLSQLFWECTLRCNLNCRHCGSDCRKTAGLEDPPMSDLLGVLDSSPAGFDRGNCVVITTGGEPLVQAGFVREYFCLCHDNGISTALDTSGAIFNEAARAVLEVTDLVLLDVKTVDDALHKRLTGMDRTRNHQFMEYLQATGKPVWIRHVVTPGINDDDMHLQAVAEYLSHYGVIERVEILPYHDLGKFKYEKMGIDYALKDVQPLSQEKQKHALDIFRSMLSCPVR